MVYARSNKCIQTARIAIFLTLCFSQSAALWSQQAIPRFALIIGNANYTDVGKLKNPINDATDIAATLKGLNFNVDLLTDADLATMEASVDRFGAKLSAASSAVGFFYYAGHGVQSAGTNYLIPVDAHISSEPYLKTKALPMQAVLDILQTSKNAVNIVVLDACRDNPFSWARSMSRGLAVVGTQPTGSILAYATSVGAVAQDGEGRNGVFTSQLLRNLATPGIDIMEMFQRTGADVQAATGGTQVPAIYSQFFGKIYLAGEVQSTQTPPSKNPGILSLTSDPPGIMVSIDDGSPVKAPTSLALLPGSHSIRTLQSFVDDVYYGEQAKQTINVAAGSTMVIPIKPQPEMANLFIQLAPAGYAVFVNDEKVGVTPLGPIRVKAGNLLIRFERNGEPSRILKTLAYPKLNSSVSWGLSLETPCPLAQRTIQLDGKPDSWEGIDPMYDEEKGPANFFMGQEGQGIIRIYMCRDAKYFYWRFDFGGTNPLLEIPQGYEDECIAGLNFQIDPSRTLCLSINAHSRQTNNSMNLSLWDNNSQRSIVLSDTSAFTYSNTKNMFVACIPFGKIQKYCTGPLSFRATLGHSNEADWLPGTENTPWRFIDFSY